MCKSGGMGSLGLIDSFGSLVCRLVGSGVENNGSKSESGGVGSSLEMSRSTCC